MWVWCWVCSWRGCLDLPITGVGWALDDSKLVVCLHHLPSTDSQFCLRLLAQLSEIKQWCKDSRLIVSFELWMKSACARLLLMRVALLSYTSILDCFCKIKTSISAECVWPCVQCLKVRTERRWLCCLEPAEKCLYLNHLQKRWWKVRLMLRTRCNWLICTHVVIITPAVYVFCIWQSESCTVHEYIYEMHVSVRFSKIIQIDKKLLLPNYSQ